MTEASDRRVAAAARAVAKIVHGKDPLSLDYEIARAALAAADAASWQDIESAPRDGTSVLLFSTEKNGSRGTKECVFWSDLDEELGWYEVDHYSLDGGDDEFCRPTHWQPLPAPPPQDSEDQPSPRLRPTGSAA